MEPMEDAMSDSQAGQDEGSAISEPCTVIMGRFSVPVFAHHRFLNAGRYAR